MPGQWEFQIGPVGPLELGDQVMIARWLLHRCVFLCILVHFAKCVGPAAVVVVWGGGQWPGHHQCPLAAAQVRRSAWAGVGSVGIEGLRLAHALVGRAVSVFASCAGWSHGH